MVGVVGSELASAKLAKQGCIRGDRGMSVLNVIACLMTHAADVAVGMFLLSPNRSGLGTSGRDYGSCNCCTVLGFPLILS